MALTGTLDSFPLPEVLRLLGRSGQTGMLLVHAGDQEMRAYLQGGQLLFACAGDERVVKARLVGAGLLDRDGWDRVASGDSSADEVLSHDVSPLDYDRAVRSLTVDGIVEVMMGRSGTFEFEEGVTTSIRLGTELSIEDTLDEVDDRMRAWNAIREIVPSMQVRIHLSENLPDGVETVELSAAEWELMTQVAMGTTVARLAARAGTSEFEMASRVAAFVTRGLAWVGDAVRPSRTVGSLERYPGVETDDEPLGAEGPMGWTNELDALPVTEPPAGEAPAPLIDDPVSLTDGVARDDADADDGDVTAFGLKGFAPRSEIADDVDDTVPAEPEDPPVAEVEDDPALEAETDEADALAQVGYEDDDDDTEADTRPTNGALPSLLRRRSKGLLAKELSSLGD